MIEPSGVINLDLAKTAIRHGVNEEITAERFGFALAMLPLLREGRALSVSDEPVAADDILHFLRRLEQRVADICTAGLHRLDDRADELLAAVSAASASQVSAAPKADDVKHVCGVQLT